MLLGERIMFFYNMLPKISVGTIVHLCLGGWPPRAQASLLCSVTAYNTARLPWRHGDV
jgi:hypothetical protein